MGAETDCRFACFNHGFAIAYSGTAASLTTAYQGSQCDCSVKGFFVGTVQLGGDMSIAASNGLNDTLTMKPVVAFNQIVLAVNSSDGYCSFAPNFAQGSLMGLPTEAPLRPSTKGVSPKPHILALTRTLSLRCRFSKLGKCEDADSGAAPGAGLCGL